MKSINQNAKPSIPALLAQLCQHPDCPYWLKLGIWDAVTEAGNLGNRGLRFDQQHWEHEFAVIPAEEVEV